MNDRPTVLPQSVLDAEGMTRLHSAVVDDRNAERLTPRERASLRGWNIDPEVTPGNPHAFGVKCTDQNCPCHGRTFRHYLRGA